MSKLDEIGIIGDDGGVYWGSKRKYPTKEAFLEAVADLEGNLEDDDVRVVADKYMRRCKAEDSDYDIMWRLCSGPARGATAVWEYAGGPTGQGGGDEADVFTT